MTGPGRFLIVSWDGGGNAPPALNLGGRLVHQGHQVRLLGWESMAARAAAAGVEFTTYPSVPPWPPGLAFEDALEERLMPALSGPGLPRGRWQAWPARVHRRPRASPGSSLHAQRP